MKTKNGNIKTAYDMSYDEPAPVIKHYANWASDYDKDTDSYHCCEQAIRVISA